MTFNIIGDIINNAKIERSSTYDKKIISGLMALTLAFPLVACGKDDDDSKTSKRQKLISVHQAL